MLENESGNMVMPVSPMGNNGNVTSTAIVRVPRGCCFSLSLRAVPGTDDPTATPAPVINVQNANLTIVRTA